MAGPATTLNLRRNWLLASWALSLLVHLLFVGGLASLVGTGGGSSEMTDVVEQEFQVQLVAAATPPAPLDPPQADKPPAPTTSGSKEPRPLDAGLATRGSASPAPSAAPPPPVFSPKELDSALAPPRVQLPGTPGAVETNFFGARAKGAKFVYVLDRSASMQQALPLARHELLHSLQQLPPAAEYQIVYYDLQARVLEIDGKSGLLQATVENKLRTSRFLDSVRSEGGTDHVRALRRGISLAPHVIYFLTDADELKPQQVHELTALNQRGSNARIHCIELNATAVARADSAMRLLARENRGEYRAVDPVTFRRPE